MRKLTQRNSLFSAFSLQWQTLLLFFLSICISFPIFSKDIYIKYDPTCLDRYVYRMNGNQVGGGLVAYSLKGANGSRIMLEVGVESIGKVKVAPKGTQSCKWINTNEKFANDFNSGRNRIFIVRPVGNYYTVSSVHLATYTKALGNGVYVAGNEYDFEYREDVTGYIPNNLGGMNSGSTFMYMTTSQYQCNKSYTVKQIPIETCKPTIDLTIIPSIGIIEEKRDVEAFSKDKDILKLESINGVPLDQYMGRICNPAPRKEVIVEAPKTEVITAKAPPVVTYEVTEKAIPVEYQPAEAEILFKHEMVEKFVPVAACQNVSRAGIHVVQPQETLFGIARKYQLNIEDIKQWNKLQGANSLHPCMELKILPPPQESEILVYKSPAIQCTQTNSPGIHVVQPEETLSSIAKTYGISVNDIYTWNNLSQGDVVQACAMLTVAPPKVVVPEVICSTRSTRNVHIIQPKENLTDIANRYNISVQDIYTWNNLSNKDLIHPCSALKIAPPDKVVVEKVLVEKTIIKCGQSSIPGIHIVQPKQTLTEVAKLYKVSIDDIYKWNNLTNKDLINACSALKVAPPTKPVVVERSVIICGENSRPGVHVVQPKETLTDISKKYNISVDDIYKWNKLTNKDIIPICKALYVALPQPAAQPQNVIVEKTVIRCGEYSRPGVHIVQPKETLSEIAKRYNLAMDDIYKWNKLSNKDVIQVCAALKIAPPKKPQAPKTVIVEKTVVRCGEVSRPGIHIVQPKETLSEIANRYNLSINDLYAWNKLTNKDIIPACAALKVVPPKQAPAPKTVIVEKTVVRCGEESRPGVHIVQPQQTLTDIAARYFISIEDLKRWNSISNKDVIPVCTALKVKPPTVITESCAQSSYRGIHIVQPRETLSEIARRYAVGIDQLRSWNDLQKGEIIKKCTALKVAPPVVNCAEKSRPGIHVVQIKENISMIARQYNITVDDIRQWNDLDAKDIIIACTPLRVAPSQPTAYKSATGCSERSSYGIHVVQPKENITEIASRYNLSIDQIRKWNKLNREDKIYPCTKLRVAPPNVVNNNGDFLIPAGVSYTNSNGDQLTTKNGNKQGWLSGNCVHIVKTGETLSEISALYGYTVERFRYLNKLKNADIIKVGQQLKTIEGDCTSGSSSKGTPAPYQDRASHIVRNNETLSSIAKKYNLTVEELRRLNGLKGDIILPNMRLYVR